MPSDIAVDPIPTDQVHGTGVDGFIMVDKYPSKWVQWNRYKKPVDVETYNRFEAIEKDIENDCESVAEFIDEEINVEPLRKLSINKTNNEIKPEKIKKTVMNLDISCLEKFETKNRFDVLINNHEETVLKIIKRNSLSSTSKYLLKKCKKCNFKKRNCLVDS